MTAPNLARNRSNLWIDLGILAAILSRIASGMAWELLEHRYRGRGYCLGLIMGAILGFIFGAVGAFIYNVVLGLIGGIEMDLE